MMDYGRLGERQRRLTLPVLEIASSILLLGAVVLIMLELVQYSEQKDDLPTDLIIAGVAVGGLSESDAQARLESVYVSQPVQLIYDGSPIVLYPPEINFHVNSELMISEAIARSNRQKSFWGGFWNFLGREPVTAVSVPLEASFPEGDLSDYLDDLAARYDTQGGQAGFDMATLTFQSGQVGRQLDKERAATLIQYALLNPEPAGRRVVLPLASADAASGTSARCMTRSWHSCGSADSCMTGRIRWHRCISWTWPAARKSRFSRMCRTARPAPSRFRS
jgi:hypothetical protein